VRWNALRTLALVLLPAGLVVAGCGGRVSASGADNSSSPDGVSIHTAAAHIDTNGTTRYSATLADGEPARVEWSVSGGDPSAGPGSISADGLYTPPSYLTEEAVTVAVNAALPRQPGTAPNPASNPVASTAVLTVTPGFLQPLTPGNLALGPSGTVSVSGSIAEVGGSGGIRFTLASNPTGTAVVPSDAGTLSAPRCVRGSVSGANPAYTVCSVTYTAPAVVPASGSVFILGSVASNPTVSWTRILLNAAGINSNPVAHQTRLSTPIQLGSSSGNNSDYDSTQGQVSDCCGGTLGALLQDTGGTQYVLSNNHVLARSDQSIPGETVIQPGLIDNGCTPYGFGPGTTPVATLTGYPALSSPATNVDAAIARVMPGAVDTKGNILELGAKQLDGTLAAAGPGVSSTGGKGETASLGMMVAKSGRTTGLTCAAVSALSVDVVVDYFTDCAETSHSMTKTFTNQIAIAGTGFSDAGDSGALVVDSANAEPVGLFFAGGTDLNGVEHAIANPVADVLATLDTQVPGPGGQQTSYSFVGGTDHAVSCLDYAGGGSGLGSGLGSGAKIAEGAAASLSATERERAETALSLAQLLLNPATGIVRVGIAVSKDHPGEGAVAFYVEPVANSAGAAAIPTTISGLPTVVLPANTQPAETVTTPSQPRAASLTQVLAIKQRNAAALLKSNPAIFGVGVGQSLDNPGDAALILFVDRKKVAGNLPELVEGQRVRILLMDRLHVTRSHGSPVHGAGNCLSPRGPSSTAEDGLHQSIEEPDLFEDSLKLPD
jgi:hypothetical protein